MFEGKQKATNLACIEFLKFALEKIANFAAFFRLLSLVFLLRNAVQIQKDIGKRFIEMGLNASKALICSVNKN